MKTISGIDHLLREYQQRVERIVATNQHDHEKELKRAQDEIVKKFNKLRELLPDVMQINYDRSVDRDSIENIIANLQRRAEDKYVAELIPTGEVLTDEVCGATFQTPALLKWQLDPESGSNFVINYDKNTQDRAIKTMNTLIGNILVSLPVKSVHLNFVDLNYSGHAAHFTSRLDHQFYRDLIADSGQLQRFCEEMQQRMVKVLQECGNLPEYNEKNKTILFPYEIVVLLDYPNQFNSVGASLEPLFQNGYKGGIYFIVMNNTDIKVEDGVKTLLSLKESYYTIKLDRTQYATNGLVNVTSLFDNSTVADRIFDYLNKTMSFKPKAEPVKCDYQKMFDTPYESTDSVIEVPVGKGDSGIVKFKMDVVSHVHCFIIGQSGSGKSVFLHNIISAAMLKYAPEDLQFYLLDFKLGGVEFNRYRGSKHVKALLVDNSDSQITLEILRDLNEQMKERGKKLRDAGVQKIADYNQMHPTEHMPQIFLVADECHAMFNRSMTSNQKHFTEISEIIAKIAKEGRSQGVHLILATQTLAGAEIDDVITNNITDHYLLKCAETDADKLLKEKAKNTTGLVTGQVYYHNVAEEARFQAYFTTNKEAETVVEYITKKSAAHRSNGEFYFSGSQKFPFDEAMKSLKAKRNPVAAVGCTMSLQREPVNITLRDDDGENVLYFGINDEEQVTRTLMNGMCSFIQTSQQIGKKAKVCVMDFLTNDEANYLDLIDDLKRKGEIELVGRRDTATKLVELATLIADKKADPTLLVIIGQEKFRDLKLDNAIETEAEKEPEPAASSADFGNDDMFGGLDFGSSSSSQSSSATDASTFDSYRKALRYIINNGPIEGVHTMMQIDKPDNLLFEDLGAKDIYRLFNHFVMLRSSESVASRMQLSDDVKLDTLNSDPDRLRAYYFDVSNDKYELFTPYALR